MRKNNLYKTFLNAVNGIRTVAVTERNFQIELLMLAINVFLILFLDLSKEDTVIIAAVCFLVLATEMINTAIEKLADFVEPNFNKKIGAVKDISAGAVLVTALLSIVVGAVVYYPYIKQFI